MFNFTCIAGYTGTQRGMNKRQSRRFIDGIVAMKPTEFHHGDCIGGDEEAHFLVREFLPDCRIIIHPPDIDVKRAFCPADIVLPPKPYLDRNHDIVIAVDKMFVTPFEMDEQLRSGTWATFRFTKKIGKPYKLILPRGKPK